LTSLDFISPPFIGSFGIGTWLMNDFKTKSSGYKEQSHAVVTVIKLGAIDGKECVKLSDEISKVRTVPTSCLSCLESHESSFASRYSIPEFQKL
jgi:nicotinic acid phosphoribosyltransferase